MTHVAPASGNAGGSHGPAAVDAWSGCGCAGAASRIRPPHCAAAIGNGPVPGERMRCDPADDACRCPGGQVLGTRYASITREHGSIRHPSIGSARPGSEGSRARA